MIALLDESRPAEGLALADRAREIPGGAIIEGDASVKVTGVQHDSRRVAQGDLFVVRRGENHDASVFVPDAIERGAVAVLLPKDACIESKVPVVRVDDIATGLAYSAAA